MRVKIGDAWYEPTVDEPLMIQLSDRDKELICAMRSHLAIKTLEREAREAGCRVRPIATGESE